MAKKDKAPKEAPVEETKAKKDSAPEFKFGVSDLAEELGIEASAVRVKLRNASIAKAGKSYGWNTKAEVKEVAATLKATKAEKAPKADKPAKADKKAKDEPAAAEPEAKADKKKKKDKKAK